MGCSCTFLLSHAFLPRLQRPTSTKPRVSPPDAATHYRPPISIPQTQICELVFGEVSTAAVWATHRLLSDDNLYFKRASSRGLWQPLDEKQVQDRGKKQAHQQELAAIQAVRTGTLLLRRSEPTFPALPPLRYAPDLTRHRS